MSNSLQTPGLQSTRLLCPWNFPGKNTGMGCHSILQGIFLNQGSTLAGRFFTTEPKPSFRLLAFQAAAKNKSHILVFISLLLSLLPAVNLWGTLPDEGHIYHPCILRALRVCICAAPINLVNSFWKLTDPQLGFVLSPEFCLSPSV